MLQLTYKLFLLPIWLAVGCTITGAAHAQATFTPLGTFGEARTIAYDVSADGSVVVGFTNTRLFRWTPSNTTFQSALDRDGASVSADGSVVVGTYLTPTFGLEAFRWLTDGTFHGLGDLPGGAALPLSAGFGVSADGGVVVGNGNTDEGFEAFRWTPATGMVGLGHLPGAENESAALGVSDDGTVVVGWGERTDLGREAMRWTAGTGMVGLGRLPSAKESSAFRVSADGSVVVGVNEFPAVQPPGIAEAFRWTEQDGMVSLGDLPGGHTFSVAYDVSADGSVVVGQGSTVRDDGAPEVAAFYWTAATGMLNLQDLLLSAGVTNLDGWLLQEARGVSADGLTIVGTGVHNDHNEAWVATIPEPATIVLVTLATVVAFVAALGRRARAV